MHSRHHRTASTMLPLNLVYADEEEIVSFTSNLTFDPPEIKDFGMSKCNSKKKSKTTTNADRSASRKFFQNYSNSSYNEHCSFLSSSTENLVKEMNLLQNCYEKNDVSLERIAKESICELGEAVLKILKNRKSIEIRANFARNSMKCKLISMFCINEISDFDTERKIDIIRCSGDTVEGPGSRYQMEGCNFEKTSRKNSKNREPLKHTRL